MPTKSRPVQAERAATRSAGRVSQSANRIQGIGIGLRTPHAAELAAGKAPVNWLEVLADNYFADGGAVHRELEAVRRHYPIALHSVGMSIGASDPLNKDYLARLKQLAGRYQPEWISDHLCFTGAGGIESHDLLPLPFTEEAVRHTAARVMQVQDFLGRRILLENVSSYLRYRHSTINEAEFTTAIAEQADCFILLDLNNAYVNEINHGESAADFIAQIPRHRIKQLHLGGYQPRPKFLLDAHDHPVAEPVWRLFADFVRQSPQIPCLIEWDNDIPALGVLLEQAARAREITERANPQARVLQ